MSPPGTINAAGAALISTVRSLTAIAALSAVLLCGCEGDPGSPGRSLLSEDLQPPVAELILPLGGEEIYEQVWLEAYATDDDTVVRVEFLVDGASVPPDGLTLERPPWLVWWDCSGLAGGPHTFQARAWDGAARSGLSALVMTVKADPAGRPEYDTLRFYDPSGEAYIDWMLPDEQGRFSGFGARFTPARPCTVLTASVRLHWLERHQYTGTKIDLELYASRNGRPDSLLASRAIRFRVMEPSDFNDWREVGMGAGGVPVSGEFFVMASMPEEHGDTIAVVSDNGAWNNAHGLVRDGGSWRNFAGGPLTGYNPLIEAVVKY